MQIGLLLIGLTYFIYSHKYLTDNPHRRGALYSNANLGMNLGMGDKPRLIYVQNCGNYPKTDVVAFNRNEDIPKDFKVDTSTMIDKTVVMKLEHILDTANIKIDELLYQGQRLEDFF